MKCKLGPRGGENGGKLVAKGRPLELIKDPQSLTVKYLADYVDQISGLLHQTKLVYFLLSANNQDLLLSIKVDRV